MGKNMKKYRPSNGTEGRQFESIFCSNCTKEQGKRTCKIWTNAMVYDINDKEYPSQLTYDSKNNPACTSFKDKNKVVRIRGKNKNKKQVEKLF